MAVSHLLDLAPERIRLVRMSGRDVEILGEIPTDAADLTPRLKALVAGAGDRPLAAALVLPESQILYTRLPAPGPDDAAREEQVRAGLDGRTPYALDEIAFDWAADGDEAVVAAIALETLDEAARFAAAHGIEVRGYLAQPEPELFPREVVFAGEAAEAATLGIEEAVAQEPAPAEPVPAAPVPVFTAMRALPDAQSLAARLAATSTRFRPSEPAGSGAAGVTAPDIPTTADPVPSAGAQQDRTPAPVTADWVPDAGPVVKHVPTPSGPTVSAPVLSAPALSAPARPAPHSAPAAAAARPPTTSLARALPQIPRRRVAIAALVAFLLIAGGWTLLATFGPRDPSESTLILPEGVEVPDTALAGAEVPGDLDPAAFVPTVEELDEGIDADVAGEPAPAPQDTARRQVFVDVPPIAGRLFALKDDSWRTAPAAPALPAVGSDFEIELAAIDPVTRSTDAFAMPPAGLPDRLPGEAPATDEPAAGVTDAPPGGVALELAGDAAQPADGALRPTALAAALTDDIRPRVRPEGIVEDAERARFNGMTLSDLAGIRPTERPASPQSDPSVNPEATALAVQRSPLPRDRPDNIDELIAIALAVQEPEAAPEQEQELTAEPPQGVAAASTATEGVATARAPDPEPAPAPEAPAATTDEEPEPEVVAAAPSMPTRAEVAREATIENAIRLRDVNLIGVYGAPSNRRALVRLPSGRFVKVQVGDRVDGGQVAAIGENSLRYVKSGREHTLVVPSG
jgi:hypothetical protein